MEDLNDGSSTEGIIEDYADNEPWLSVNNPSSANLISTEEQSLELLDVSKSDESYSDESSCLFDDSDLDHLDTSFSSDESLSSLSTLSTPSASDYEQSVSDNRSRKRSPSHDFFPRKRMRLLPPRPEPVTVSEPYIVYMLKEEEIDEDWKIIKNSLTSCAKEK